jgi:H+/Cl- antiporter ClcA
MAIETTKDANISFPVLLTTIFSYGVANSFTNSYTIELGRFPFVPKLMKTKIYEVNYY